MYANVPGTLWAEKRACADPGGRGSIGSHRGCGVEGVTAVLAQIFLDTF